MKKYFKLLTCESYFLSISSFDLDFHLTQTLIQILGHSIVQTQEGDGSEERINEVDDTNAFSSSISGRIDHILNELKITQRLGKKNNDNKQKKNVSEVITCTKYFAVYFLNLFIL